MCLAMKKFEGASLCSQQYIIYSKKGITYRAVTYYYYDRWSQAAALGTASRCAVEPGTFAAPGLLLLLYYYCYYYAGGWRGLLIIIIAALD